MRLRKLQLVKFRAFRDAEIVFEPSGLTVVVGANNAGKSALLSGLDVVAGEELQSVFTHAGADERQSQVLATFTLDDQERLGFITDKKQRVKWGRTKLFRELTFRFIQSTEPGRGICAEIVGTAPTGSTFPLAFLSRKPSSRDTEYRLIHGFREWFSQHPPGTELPAPDLGGTSSEMLKTETLLHQASLEPLLGPFLRWRENYFHFRALRVGTDRVRTFKADTSLNVSGENLTEALVYLQTQSLPAWEGIRALVAEALPDIGQLQIPAVGSTVEIAFSDPYLGVRQNIKDLGTGVEQLLMTAYVGLTKPEASLVVIEEPETNLHPGAQRILLQHLQTWSQEKQFVMSTHSPTFLAAGSGTPVWTVRRREGESFVEEQKADLTSALSSIGVQLSDTLSSDRILILEGETDLAILTSWFSELATETSLATMTGGGGDAAWQVVRVSKWLDEADALPRRLLFLRDRDELDEASVRALIDTGVVHVLGKREIENYLLDIPSMETVLKRRCDEANKTYPFADLESLSAAVSSASDHLQNHVLLKRVANELKPVRLLSRKDVQQMVDDSSTLESLLAVVETNLPSKHLIDQIRELWTKEAESLNAEWESSRLDLAPGAEILDEIWSLCGLKFNKGKDGSALAMLFQAPPELQSLVAAFLDG